MPADMPGGNPDDKTKTKKHWRIDQPQNHAHLLTSFNA
jgi:hypothetical protein